MQVLEALPVQRLKRSTLFVDVLSVKEFPRQVMRRMLPAEVDILCTHPMFGPDSGKGSWAGLNFMYEIVRVGDDDPRRKQRIDNFIRVRSRAWWRMGNVLVLSVTVVAASKLSAAVKCPLNCLRSFSRMRVAPWWR